MWSQHKLFSIGVALAATFWLLEAALHAWVFGDGVGFGANILPGGANEWWMRSLAALLFIGFGAYADRASHALLRVQEERRVIQARLDDALTRVLRGYLSICASCKAIREGERWIPLETFVTGHTRALFSHGLCPQCLLHFEEGV